MHTMIFFFNVVFCVSLVCSLNNSVNINGESISKSTRGISPFTSISPEPERETNTNSSSALKEIIRLGNVTSTPPPLQRIPTKIQITTENVTTGANELTEATNIGETTLSDLLQGKINEHTNQSGISGQLPSKAAENISVSIATESTGTPRVETNHDSIQTSKGISGLFFRNSSIAKTIITRVDSAVPIPIWPVIKPITNTGENIDKEPNTNTIPGDISKEKCNAYVSYSLSWGQSYVSGGSPATFQEFPHMALLGYVTDKDHGSIQWSCGGSLISEKFVLTAAHCITGRTPPKFVRLGITEQYDYNSCFQERLVSEVIPYPEYKRKEKYHDIALIRLEKEVCLTRCVYPACLHTQKNIEQKWAIATGWGYTNFLGPGSDHLLKVQLDFFTPEHCTEAYMRQIARRSNLWKRGIDEDLLICAGSMDEIKDTCQGDSGGPLQVYYNNPGIYFNYHSTNNYKYNFSNNFTSIASTKENEKNMASSFRDSYPNAFNNQFYNNRGYSFSWNRSNENFRLKKNVYGTDGPYTPEIATYINKSNEQPRHAASRLLDLWPNHMPTNNTSFQGSYINSYHFGVNSSGDKSLSRNIHNSNNRYMSTIDSWNKSDGNTPKMDVNDREGGYSPQTGGSYKSNDPTSGSRSCRQIDSSVYRRLVGAPSYGIVGVTAFGSPCSIRKGVPGIYTRVSHYIEWIENIVWPQ